MTEDEARTKWCPMVNVATADGTAFTSRGAMLREGIGNVRCIASGCMMWRWEWEGEPDGKATKGDCGLKR